jgi:hypothetical protein
MRLGAPSDGRSHEALDVGAHDHHNAPESVSFSNTAQSLPPGATFDLDVPLGRTGYQLARVQITGPAVIPAGISSALWRECAELVVTTDSSEAVGHSIRDAASPKKVYAATYSKQNGDSYLTHKIFDSNTGSGNRYICVQDAVITGSILRITFRNYFGGSATLWVKGQALVW